MGKYATAIVWFRNDLRLTDNTALHQALLHAESIVHVFIHAPHDAGEWTPGAASRWWLHHSLDALGEEISRRGGKLILRKGSTVGTLRELVTQTSADAVFASRCYEPSAIELETQVRDSLNAIGVATHFFDSNLLISPDLLANSKGQPFKVFTPFWNVLSSVPARPPLPPASSISLPTKSFDSIALDDLQLLPKIRWDAGLEQTWKPGEAQALLVFRNFLKSRLQEYCSGRDIPSDSATSLLSPHLHFGEISPRFIWHELLELHATTSGARAAAMAFLRQIGWREFGYHLLYHFPETANHPLRPEFESFPSGDDKRLLDAWQKGKTGYPIVDAGMRQLWTTGYMHNRVRMLVASFLVKDLLLGWQHGARWFWDTLVDADLANNTLGWQWTAGCGADAAPYFRIFNPVLQGEKFDPNGGYVRRWIPELAKLDRKWIHKPWTAPVEVLAAAGITLGSSYPLPIVDHGVARARALSAFQEMKSTMPNG
jgi:deoxyribodipyrimidine photo-lyase